MLKGLALTPPILGRISIGKVLVNDKGQRIPQKDDEFTVTTLVQNRGEWVDHPVDAKLRKDGKKLRRIPVRLLFDDPDLNFRANYSMFDRETGRPVCVGDGNNCKRATLEGIKTLPCPSPDLCEASKKNKNGCKPFGRFSPRIDIQDENIDELGCFPLRTTGFNSIRTLYSRQMYLNAVTGGGLLSCLPLDMVLRGKSTTQSHRVPVYFVDLMIRTGMTIAQAIAEAKKIKAERDEAGIDQTALDAAARAGLSYGEFEESVEEGQDIVPEFYPEGDAGNPTGAGDAGPDEPPTATTPPQGRPMPTLPDYPQDVMQTDLPALTKMIQSGKKTPEGIVAFLSTKYTLSDNQRASILNISATQAS